MNILELLEGVIRKPVATFNLIAQEKPVGWALAIFFTSMLLGSVTADHAVFEQLSVLPAPNMAVQIPIFLGGLFILAGLLHLISRIFKGSGDYWGLFSALGFAQFPGFLTPTAALMQRQGGLVGVLLGGIISLGSGIWVLVLYVIALRESRGISTGAGILTYLITVLIIGVPVVGGVAYLIIKSGLFL